MYLRLRCVFLYFLYVGGSFVNGNIDTTNNNKEAHREHVRRNLLPSSDICGQQQTDDRIPSSSNNTAYDEFPWLVVLKLDSGVYFGDNEGPYQYSDPCNGVLISKRYILTDAYCGYEAFRVILGQYKTGQMVSCADETKEECTEPTREYQIYSKVRSGKRSNGPIDFSLIRLNTTVHFSDFIRPICLPLDGLKSNQTNLTFSGWGASGPAGIQKKRLVYNVVHPEVCYNASVGLEGNAEFANKTLVCLSPPPENTDTTCIGENGGPFMYKYNYRWYLEGIALQTHRNGYNYEDCGSTFTLSGLVITPSVIDWILDNMHD